MVFGVIMSVRFVAGAVPTLARSTIRSTQSSWELIPSVHVCHSFQFISEITVSLICSSCNLVICSSNCLFSCSKLIECLQIFCRVCVLTELLSISLHLISPSMYTSDFWATSLVCWATVSCQNFSNFSFSSPTKFRVHTMRVWTVLGISRFEFRTLNSLFSLPVPVSVLGWVWWASSL